MVQKRLFDDDPPEWELEHQDERPIASVVFAIGGPPGQFDYEVPESMVANMSAGRRVVVPLGRGNRPITAYCVDFEVKPVTRRVKQVQRIIDEQRLFSDEMLRLTEWIADYYLCDLGQVLETVVPAGVRDQAGTRMATMLHVSTQAEQLAPSKKERKLTPQQEKTLTVLRERQPLTASELMRFAGVTASPINTLKRRGLILSRRMRINTTESDDAPSINRDAPLTLNEDQQNAIDAILDTLRRGAHETFLVHGVTGSGKTEVYIQAIEEVVKYGRQAIVLVPEISLTPQTVGRFRARFADVAVLHSRLTDADRHAQWKRIASGRISVVVGARSAIFAPVPHLGLIVLDEEHESSFKQGTAPRYHARDVAIKRSAMESVPLILGSATPSLETWHRAQVEHYRLIDMPRRINNRPMPDVRTVDLRLQSRGASAGAIHRQLQIAMRETLKDRGQIILLLNRRGFSTHIQCPACGGVVACPDCEISLTHHRTDDLALCHYCDYQITAPRACPECSYGGIRYSGLGTQKLEAEVRNRFKGVECIRMDGDTMQGRDAHEKALEKFRSGEAKILLGTQMIAKGLDFPNVTLVGVINADTALHLPDFRAAERTFQLITQVAGRTGRSDRGGRVLIQTYNPEHPAIVCAQDHNYLKFAEQELPSRKALAYPPFAHMARFVVRGPDEKQTVAFADDLARRVREAMLERVKRPRLLGPAPAPFAKLRGLYRFHFQVQTTDVEVLRDAIRQATNKLASPDGIQWIVDVDPIEML
jgi:primosomal protein N' (replication factor Y) (superfamily II helicase)